MIAAAALLLSLISPSHPLVPPAWLAPLEQVHGQSTGGTGLLRSRLVAGWLAAFSKLERVNLMVLADPREARAYACPGGWIAITQGMLDRCDGGVELALVLAHEIAHLEAGHPEEMLRRHRLGTLAAMAGAVMWPTSLQIGAGVWEAWCDQRAVELLQEAGYSNEAVSCAWERLRNDLKAP